MRFTIPADQLRSALSTAKSAVPASSALVAYSGVLLLVKGERLSVIGSDGETAVAASVAVPDAVDGEALIAPRPLHAYLSELPAGVELDVSVDGFDLVVAASTQPSPYRFRVIQAKFPRPPAARAAAVPVDFSRLADAVAAVRAAVDPEHGGVWASSNSERLLLAATDHYQMHAVTVPGAGFGEFTGVIPLHVLDRVARHQVTGVVGDPTGRTLRFSGDGLLVSTRLLTVAIPDMTPILAAAPTTGAVIDTAELRHALGRLLSVSASSAVSVEFAPGVLRLSASNMTFGAGAEEVTAVGDMVGTVALSPERLVDAVSAHRADKITFSVGGPLEPVFLTSATALPTTTVVSPVREV